MAVSRNDITGDSISTKHNSTNFVNNWDLIFGKKNKDEQCTDEGTRNGEGVIIPESPSDGCGK